MNRFDSTLLWTVMLAMGLGTLLIRASFIVGMGRREPSAWMRRCLRPVPAAVLSALVAPAFFVREGSISLDGSNPRMLAGLLAALIAWRTKNAFLTIAGGMVVLWLTQWWMGR